MTKGLRGALAFALSINVPTPNGGTILTTTLFIALFTVLFLGGFTTKMLQVLKIQTGLDPTLVFLFIIISYFLFFLFLILLFLFMIIYYYFLFIIFLYL